ncbi:uncharacterized protein LOC110443292 isoform X3 [Mizuhopecten yessoensis]|uniref:uncharacterized protein LOC110443292 isoform X3 n=1 Tax=Mizuhopecten yessoensis TaxID=6573 RepID=UPI000B45ABAC|nr:uncharacterized protein LOC110443292 isoform X3 [Mizuhopecten yessoensis]
MSKSDSCLDHITCNTNVTREAGITADSVNKTKPIVARILTNQTEQSYGDVFNRRNTSHDEQGDQTNGGKCRDSHFEEFGNVHWSFVQETNKQPLRWLFETTVQTLHHIG